MNDPRDIRADLEPGVTEEEILALQTVADRLVDERPVPAAGFRAHVRSSFVGERAGRYRPAGLRVAIAGWAGSGALLLLVAAVGLAGVGPFAA